MCKRLHVGYILLLIAAVAAGQNNATTSMSHRVEGTTLRFDFTYPTPPSGAKLLYQKYLNNQPLGGVLSKDPAPESSGGSLVFLVPAELIKDADVVGVVAQTTDGKTPELRVSLTEITGRDELATRRAKETELIATVSQLRGSLAALKAENQDLRNAATGVAHYPQYIEAPAVFTDGAVLHFTSTSVGRIRVQVSDDKPAPNTTQRTVDGEFTKQHYIRIDHLPPGKYTAVAWPLDVQNNIIVSEKADHDNQGNAITFTTRQAVDPVQLDPLTTSGTGETIIDVSVTSPRIQKALLKAELYRVGEQAAVQKVGDDLDLAPNTLPSDSRLSTQWPRSFKFTGLTAGTQYRVVVTAMNELGVTSSREATIGTSAAFDFTDAIDVNVTPAGYILTWHANAEPKTNSTDPTASIVNGFRLVFNNLGAPVTSVPASVNGKDLTAALNVTGIRSVLSAVNSAVGKDEPRIEVFMTSSSGKEIKRTVRVHFDKPDEQTLSKLNLTVADKTKIQTTLDQAGQDSLLQKSFWKKVWQQGLKAIITAL